MHGIVYLIPSALYEQHNETIPAYVIEAVKACDIFFVENERTARRYLKSIWKEVVIDDYEWVAINKAEEAEISHFIRSVSEGKNAGIISEAGCPGIADPGQLLISAAQARGFTIKPLVGPNSILLALMASGLNGQQFQFHGYLPVDREERNKAIRELERESRQRRSTQIFIETPYRNNQLVGAMLTQCHPSTRLCIASDLTSGSEYIHTKSIEEWKQHPPDLHKRPSIFCLLAT